MDLTLCTQFRYLSHHSSLGGGARRARGNTYNSVVCEESIRRSDVSILVYCGVGARGSSSVPPHLNGRPSTGARAFNRPSGPDANSCAGCHSALYGIAGGGGDFVTNVFVLGQRFDFATLDASDNLPTRGGKDEKGVALNA
jgi:hypothetical protein